MTRKILRVDMTTLKTKFEDLKGDWANLGGRALTSSIVAKEVPPTVHPLGHNNKLVLAPGIVTGTAAPTSGRISVGAKSPLTGGIKEANAGTPFAQKLAKMQVAAIIVEGKYEGDMQMLKLAKDKVEFSSAKEFTGIGLYKAYKDIFAKQGKNVAICGTGIAGELLSGASGVAFSDPEGLPSRYAGRGGLGAVMASKGLKLIVVDDSGAPGVEVKDKALFDKGREKLAKALGQHDVTKPGGALSSYGTSVLVNIINEAGGLPQNNFSSGRDDRAAQVSGEKKADEIKKRGGTRPHQCSPGCVIRCSEVWTKEGGKDPVGCLEYESVWALGPNCGIYNLDTLGELNRACNDLGLDTIEMGGTIGVAMEGGLAKFGDGKAALGLLEEIRKKTPTGRILANGCAFTGKALGVTRVPVVKHQSMPAYDPRAIKGIGVTYATTPMGADHTAGYAIATEIMGVGGKANPRDKNKSELSRNLQVATAFIDSAGYCLFTAFAVLDIPSGLEGMVESVSGVLGAPVDVPKIGMQVLTMERAFNKAAGITVADDRIPEFMKEEKLPPTNEVFDVPDAELDKVFGA
jgi:aldehyde:ferredoxin oxidoreductase